MTVGAVLARVTRVLKQSTGSELVYVNVFGERVAHLHFNLAPHTRGDALTGGPGMLASGAAIPEQSVLTAVSERIRTAMASEAPHDTMGQKDQV